MIKKIAHIGVAVRNLGDAQTVFQTLLGMEPSHVQRVESQKVDVSSFHVDDTNIELTCGTSPDSPISIASLSRCRSPPESVVSGWPRRM